MLKVIIPNSEEKLQQQIKALEYTIRNDTNDKDKQIHLEALGCFKQAIKQ